MTIENSKVLLRAVEPGDLDILYLLENASGRSEAGFTTAPMSRFQISQYIQNYTADIYENRQLRLMIVEKVSGDTVGAIDIADFDPRDRRGFVGVAIVENARRRGLGKSALTLLCDYAGTVLGMHQLAAQVVYDNDASHALFRSCGFNTCGSLRSWVRRGRSYVDVLIYQKFCDV